MEGYEALKAQREELQKISPSNDQIFVFHDVFGKISVEKMLAEKRRLESIISSVFNVEMIMKPNGYFRFENLSTD